MEQHSASDHFKSCPVEWWYANFVFWFTVPRKYRFHSKQRRRKNSRNRLSKGIDEDGDDEVLVSEDVEFGDEDNEVDMKGVPVWRKKLGKILEEFQDAIVRIDKDSLRIIRLLDDSRFENWFVIPENVNANEGRF